jgi:hypothetical protein
MFAGVVAGIRAAGVVSARLSNQILFDNQPPAFQQAVFTWQPQHIGIFPVEYELRIYRQRPGMQQLPQGVIMQETPPYIRIKTATTNYILRPTDPPLLLDETYFAEVQIYPVGYPAIFKNRGKSAFIEFKVASDEHQICVGPQAYKGYSLTEGSPYNGRWRPIVTDTSRRDSTKR